MELTTRTGAVLEASGRGFKVARCNWLVEVPNGHPEPDSRADMFDIVDCGEVLRTHGADGRLCDAGHEFGNLEARLAPFGPEWEAERREAAEEGFHF